MGSKTLALLLACPIAIPLLLRYLLVPILVRTVGVALGWYLRKKTAGRRWTILTLAEKDEERYREDVKQHKATAEEDDWENVDSSSLGTSQNGDKGEKEWDGIVGFFHPFW